MKMTTKLTKFDDQFKEYAKRNDERINQLNAQLEALTAKKAKTEADIVKAETLENVEQSVKKTIELNETLEVTDRAIGFVQEKIAKIKDEPLLTKTEFRDILSQIETQADTEMDALLAKLKKPVNEIKKIALESRNVQIKADELIQAVYKDLIKKDPWDVMSNFYKDDNGALVVPTKEYRPSSNPYYFYDRIKGNAIAKGLIKE